MFRVNSRTGAVQEMKFEDAVSVTRNADQSFAVVMVIRIDSTVRAATTIEVRRGDVLSRAVIFTDEPMPTPTVRGVASLMGKRLETVS